MRRVLRLLTRPNVGGPTKQAISLWHAHKQLGLRTLLVVGQCDPGESSLDLSALGIPEMTPTEILNTGPKSEGFVVIPQLRRRLSPLTDPPAFRAICRILRARSPLGHMPDSGYGKSSGAVRLLADLTHPCGGSANAGIPSKGMKPCHWSSGSQPDL